MLDLYSYKGAYPYPLPEDMSKYNINDFVIAPEKPSVNAGEVLEWTGTEWLVRPANTSETEIKWQEIRNQRNTLLQETDVKILKELEQTGSISQSLKDYRQALRDVPQTQTNPFTIVWPTL